MRRSAAVTLTVLAAAGLGLAYCGGGTEADPEGVLETEDACVTRLGNDAAPECADVFQSARAAHRAGAPHFDSLDSCRAATGGECEALPAAAWAQGAPVFIPVMAGVMIGQLLADGSRGAVPVYAGALPPACLPGGAGGPGCPPSGSGSSSSSSTGASGRRYWYSGTSYAGYSDGSARAGFRRSSSSPGGEAMLSRGARSGPGAGHAGSSRSGGFGSAAAAHSGGGA